MVERGNTEKHSVCRMRIEQLVQIAGISDAAEARMLISAGIDWLGFPFRLPVHQEDISEQDAVRIIANLARPRAGVLITYLKNAVEVIKLMQYLGVKIVQLHGSTPVREVILLKEKMPDALIVKSLIVKENNLTELRDAVAAYGKWVDGFITDTHDPISGADGATGKVHDWHISRCLVECSPRPVILAGGLNPENIREAILKVRPAGVDVHTGVEAPSGRKCSKKVRLFVERARDAFLSITGSSV